MTAPYVPQMALYRDWLKETRGLAFADFEAMRRWSVTDIDAFWQSVWDYFDLRSPTPHSAVLADRKMPGALWFPGASVNYARQVFRHVGPAHAAADNRIKERLTLRPFFHLEALLLVEALNVRLY